MATSPVVLSQKPTRVRYWVVVFAVTLAIITYFDRVCMSFAAPFVQRDLGLTKVQMGYAFAAFGWAYALFEIPGGFLGDWMGPRKVLMRIVCWWSSFTFLTGSVFNFVSIVTTQFFFGVGEAGCFPNLAKAFSTWLPSHERLRAEGFKAASARWGGAVTPVLFVSLQQWLGWRGVFQIFAAIGAIWALGFYAWYHDDPREATGINEAELHLIGTGSRRRAGGHPPWSIFLRSRSAWLLWLNWFCYSYGFYFYLTWLPTYLQQAHRLDLKRSAALAGLPLLTAGMGSVFSGFVCAWLMTTRRIAFVRRTTAIAGFAIAATMFLIFTRLQDAAWIITVLAVSSFAAEFCGPVTWTTCMDLGGGYVGSLAGAMNTLGQLGGALAPAAIGYILKWTNYTWTTVFYVSAAVYCCGILCWSFLDPVTPLDPERTNR